MQQAFFFSVAPTITRDYWKILLVPLVFLFFLGSISFGVDDQPSRAVRRSTAESGVPAKDQRRVALVIGNSDYRDAPLRNPAHDAEDIASVLRGLGFAVHIKINANQREIEDAVKEFVGEIQNGDVGLFYFSGHGVQVHGENYLMPVGGSITSEADVKYKAVSAGHILAQMDESRNRINIFVLDACRNNPFKGFRSMSKGLTMMDAPVGTFIAYATAPGSVAADGTDRNSPYAKHLVQTLKVKDIKIEDVFKRVLREVRRETQGQQVPWIASSLQDDFYFNPSSRVPVQETSLPHSTSSGMISATFSEYRAKAHRLGLGDLDATMGDTSARDELWRMCKDPEAVKLFQQAAEKGDVLAQLMLGRMFYSGIGVSKDRAEAVKWFKKSADQGNALAQNNLGKMYYFSHDVPQDYGNAARWYRKSADRGNAVAQVQLGWMYWLGHGVPKSDVEAVKWYRKSADQGNAEAQSKLAYMLDNGYGVPQDRSEAIQWYKKAANQGDERAKKALQKRGVPVK